MQYNQKRESQKVYVAGREGRVSLAKLVADQYAKIQIVHEKTTYRDITIVGVPGMVAHMTLEIGDGYQGRIVLENVFFDSGKTETCINIGNQCEVILVLQGDNELRAGGIRVPEGSKLILEGNGNLLIQEDYNGYFGIGNDLKSAHGTLEFEQDGIVEIQANGMKGIGIGSGYGGNMHINKGKYILNLKGREGVGIGAFYSGFSADIRQCDIHMNIDISKGVGIGSMEKNARINLENLSARFVFGGEKLIGIGTVDGGESEIGIYNANIEMDLRATNLCGIGAENGLMKLNIEYASVRICGEGKYALAFGNRQRNAQIRIVNATVYSKLKTSLDTDIGASEEDIYIANARCIFTLNGKSVMRKVEDVDL